MKKDKQPERWEKIRFFKPSEFACPCCGTCEMDERFMSRLDGIRYAVGRPLKITSGYRCPAYNAEVGGVPDSSHTRGLAADIAIEDDSMRYELRTAAGAFGLTRFGHGRGFMHIDDDPAKNQGREWTY